MSIKAGLLKRLEEVEKKIKPGRGIVIVTIKESHEKGGFVVTEAVDFGGHKKDYKKQWTVKANTAQEVADSYQPPEGCKEPLVFIYDFGE